MSQVYTLLGKEEAAVNDEESINSARQKAILGTQYLINQK